MSFYTNVIEQDLINLRNLAEQQKKSTSSRNEKKRISKQTLDIKVAESLLPITKKPDVDEVKGTTRKIGDIITEALPETLQSAIEITPTHQPIENNEGVIYDIELE